MSSELQLDVSHLNRWRRHLVNAYEVNGRYGLQVKLCDPCLSALEWFVYHTRRYTSARIYLTFTLLGNSRTYTWPNKMLKRFNSVTKTYCNETRTSLIDYRFSNLQCFRHLRKLQFCVLYFRLQTFKPQLHITYHPCTSRRTCRLQFAKWRPNIKIVKKMSRADSSVKYNVDLSPHSISMAV